jgi:voltage-gated potassium channel
MHKQINSLSNAGEIFSVFFVILAVVTVAYAIGTIVEFVVEGNIIGLRRRRKMDHILENIRDHYIISGYGRVGHTISKQFEAEKIPFVVIDAKPETAGELDPRGIPYVIGNVSSDEVLEKAGIKRAKGLVAAADSDTENVYVTLTAKDMNPDVFVIARASHKETESKLKKAGADKVISPYFIAGNRMASMAIRPVSVDFLDSVIGTDNVELWMKEITIREGTQLSNKTLGEAQIRQTSGAIILTIKKSDGKFETTPKADSRMDVGSIVVALGTSEQLERLQKMA